MMTTSNQSRYEIQKTENLDQFVPIQGNRPQHRAHVENLKSSIEKMNCLHLMPIIVNSEMEVVDGNHRLVAAKELELPIYYVIDDNYEPDKLILFNNVTLRWTLKEYMNFYVLQGNDDYIKFDQFMYDMGFSVSTMFEWISDRPKKMQKEFKNGTFKFSVSIEIVNAMLNTKRLIQVFKERRIKPHNLLTRLPFHRACKKFFLSPLVDPEVFFERLAVCPHSLHVDTWEGFIQQLADIYNYQKKKRKIQVRYEGQSVEIVR